MPRTARIKSSEAVYHIMSHSISEVDLFRCDEDKFKFLSLLKRYKDKFHCEIYAYCLMSNHYHIYINPCGCDISTFMHSLNSAYVAYYNKTYSRLGHLFHERFASKIVDNDTYSITLSAYIHNNAADLPGFSGGEETYRFSSYGIYTGYRKDTEGIVNEDFILRIFGSNKEYARRKYRTFVESMKGTGIMKEMDDEIISCYTENEYRSEKQHIVRERSPGEVMRKIGELLGERAAEGLRAKYSREMSGLRAFATYVMRVLCGFTYKKICEYIGNMSMSGVTRLSNHGFMLTMHHPRYRAAFNSLIQTA